MWCSSSSLSMNGSAFILPMPSSHLLCRRAPRKSLQAINVVSDLQLRNASSPPDSFVLDLAEKLEETEYVSGFSLAAKETMESLRERSAEAVLSSPWPSNKVESYRFTDVRFLKNFNIEPISLPSADVNLDGTELNLSEKENTRIVYVDGAIISNPSSLSVFQEGKGMFFGSISSLSDDIIRENVLPKLGSSAEWINADFFASLNGIGATELGVIIVPEGVKVEDPMHVLYYSSQGGKKGNDIDDDKDGYFVSSPRLLVLVGKGAELHIVEEFIGGAGELYWANAVAEFFIEDEAQVFHSYVQNQGRHAVHIKQTCVAQKEQSSYQLVEAELGSKLSRHNLHIQQLGADTTTKMSNFMLAGQNQLQDLHSRLILSHPRGFARQLQKCIVMNSSGHCVFDGNVKVNRYAQQTDAGQLSRSLLLAPRATVNIKPNLQIIADDVKCSHGAAISDLEEEQIFYFQARGIDPQTARSILVFSFGAEVLNQFEYPKLQKRIESTVQEILKAEGAIISTSQ